jgi:hypothetical protein
MGLEGGLEGTEVTKDFLNVVRPTILIWLAL